MKTTQQTWLHGALAIALVFALLSGCQPAEDVASNSQPPTEKNPVTVSVTPAEARAIAREAAIYGFPVVDNYRINYEYFFSPYNPNYKGPQNTIINTPRVYTPADTTIQTPNSDTPYSFVGADLRAEPLVLSVPEIEKERYYSLQFIDAYTFNFAYAGSRTTGNGAGNFLLAGPNWKGEKPEGIKEVIQCDTELAFVVYRTQLFDPADIDNVKQVQAGYKVQPLSKFLGQPAPPAAPKIDYMQPCTPEEERKSLKQFEVLNFVLQFCPTVPSEVELRERFAKIGISAGKDFDSEKFSPEVKKAIEEGIADAWLAFDGLVKEFDAGKVTSGDVFGTRKYLKNDYLYRMGAAAMGIYGNSKQEAMYPVLAVDAEGKKLTGANRYTLHFAKGELPPVKAFWSITMYELPKSLLVANPINRYLINSPMLPELKKDADGGLTLYIQNESPGADKESNWLPAPQGPFVMYMRLYWPAEAALDGSWKAPQVQKVSAVAATSSDETSSLEEIQDIAAEGFIYGLPIVMNYAVMYEYSVDKDSGQYKAPFNQIMNEARVFTYKDTAVVTPNSDTPYSFLWMDLRSEPVVLSVPAVEKKRYYAVQLEDGNTFNYGYIGSRATGNEAGDYLVAGPDWKGETPAGIKKVFRSSTQFSLAGYRTQLFNAEDMPNVIKIQAGYKVQPLSTYLKQPAPQAAPAVDFPKIDKKLAETNFFAYLDFALQFAPAGADEKEIRAKLAKIGVGPDATISMKNLSPEQKEAIGKGMKAGLARIDNYLATQLKQVNGWKISSYFGDRAFFNGNWLLRAAGAKAGIYGNDAIEATYPLTRSDSEGNPLDGSKNNYTLTFAKGELPPANAFWSVTMYDGKTQLLIENPINRYLINSPMLPDLKKNDDGSLTLYIQHKSPGAEKESNWLPAPDGSIYLAMRIYWPKTEPPSVLPPGEGSWKPPGIVRASK